MGHRSSEEIACGSRDFVLLFLLACVTICFADSDACVSDACVAGVLDACVVCDLEVLLAAAPPPIDGDSEDLEDGGAT